MKETENKEEILSEEEVKAYETKKTELHHDFQRDKSTGGIPTFRLVALILTMIS